MHRATLFATPLLCLLLAAGPALADGRDVSKVNGGITAEAGRQYGDLDTVNGGITIEAKATVGDAETVNGGIRADDDVTTKQLSTVNGGIRVGERARIGGNVETVNGGIFIGRGGTLDGNVETVNGAIGLVQTAVAGNIDTVNGDITVGVGSHVRGGIKVSKPSSRWFPVQVNKRKPRIVIGPDAVVDGTLVFEREVVLYVHESARIGAVTGATPIPFQGSSAPRE